MSQNKLTTALVAVGVVSLASAARAEEKLSALQTAVSSTTLSGYVDTSMQWNFGTGNANNPPYSFGGASKADGFNLNVVQLSLDKPLDESQWAAGYHVDLWFGPDANTLGTQSTTAAGAGDLAIRQAYVTLRTPVGNGLDWKIGVFDTVIGYESLSSPSNPHYTHSYGFTIEPTTHTGLLASYKVNDAVSLSAGVANTVSPAINGRSSSPYTGGVNTPESYKAYMAAIALTAPNSWGSLSGSTLYAGFVNGFNAGFNDSTFGARTLNFYSGVTASTPVSGLKVGASVDYLEAHDGENPVINDAGDGTTWAWALYTSYQATEKLSLNLRGEYVSLNSNALDGSSDITALEKNGLEAITATAQYDLWKNVISRLEFRWDHVEHGQAFGGEVAGTPNRNNAYMLAANVIYKF